MGKVFGANASIDIDLFFPDFLAGELLFDAVQLIDDFNEGDATSPTVGADIDAVGAISTIGLPVPGPSTLALLGVALVGLGFSRRRKLH